MAVTIVKAKKDRSPSFPFIPLGLAVQRLEAFDKHFGRHATPANRVGLAWGMKEKSSQADQTLAALRSFGLVTYNGSGSAREVTVSDEGRTYLRAQQESIKEASLKQAALRPKVLRKFWALWGKDRPVNAVALDTLILHNAFSDSGARDFLEVYDETVSFAKLSNDDKVLDVEGDDDGDMEEKTPLNPPPLLPKNEVRVMTNERELIRGPLAKDASFRLIVSGAIGVKEIERLIQKLEFDKEILAEPDASKENDA
jgi:hypothetical protein